MTYLLTLFFIAVAILLVIIILLQRGRGGGLSGAFGSGGGSTSAFGTKTGDVFTTITVILFVVFMCTAVWLNWRFRDYKEKIQGAAEPTATSLPTTPSLPVVPPSTNPATLPKLPPTTNH